MSRKRNFHDDSVLQDPGGAGAGPGPRTVKKARFASGSDPKLEAGESAIDKVVEEELDLPSSRQAVRLDGYDSDSSAGSDGQGKGKATATADDGDEDMFTSGPPPTAKAQDKRDQDDSDRIKDSGLAVKGGANKEYLDLGDIDGQEFGKTTDELQETAPGMENDTDSQESFVSGDEHANDDEAPRSRRSKKGMGYVISRFNMRDEMEEGRFNAEGTFIANDADPYAQHDAWLDDVSSKSAIKAARNAKDKQQQDADQKDRQDREMAKTRPECMKGLLESGLLDREKDETVTAALARLGAAKRKITQADRKNAQKARRGQKKQNTENGGDTATDESSAPTESNAALQEITRQIDQLTTTASLLLDIHGELDIYEQSFTDMVKTLRLEGEVPRGWEPAIASQAIQPAPSTTTEQPAARRGIIARPSANGNVAELSDTRSFMYKWKVDSGVPKEQLGRSFGPFSGNEMRAWAAQSFFGPNGGNITVALASEAGKDTSWQDFTSAFA